MEKTESRQEGNIIMAKEVRTASASGGEKGVKKQRYELIPAYPMTELARLYGRGARKYADHNFRRGYEWSKSFGALQRHANLFWSGEDIDLEMNLNHLISVAWHAYALTEFQAVHTAYDDRPNAPKSEGTTVTLGSYDEPFKHEDLDDRPADEIEPRFDLLPARPTALLAEAYGVLDPIPADALWSSLYSRMQEHAYKFWAGENEDANGILHTVHVIRYTFELLNRFHRKELDNRLIEGAAFIGFDSNPA